MRDSGADGVDGALGRPAELGPRVLARLIDSGVLFLAFLILVVPALVVGNYGGSFSLNDGFGALSGPRFMVTVGWAVVVIAYFALMESAYGQTVGKIALCLETQGPDGGKPSLEMAVNRNLWNVLSIVPVVGGMLALGVAIYIAVTIGQSANRTGWHDRFAGGTRVIQRPLR